MATYFNGNSEIPGSTGDGLQTLILMNPSYVGYSDTAPPQNNNSHFVFLNSNSAGNFSHAPPSQSQHFVGIPLHGGAPTSAPVTSSQDVSALHGYLPRAHYNMYDQQIDVPAAREMTRSQHGLSLSLSSQQPMMGYGSFRPEKEAASQPVLAGVTPPRGEDVGVSRVSPSSASGFSTGVQSVLLSSKYLKAAQELLDEVVNVGNGTKNETESAKGYNGHLTGDSSAPAEASAAVEGQSGGERSAKSGTELTTAERHEIHMKKAKLVNMLDEVEQRYRQYHHQMQIVISWFEQATGIGSAKTYTSLALQTISKQFRCLKDAILSQIKASSKNLGEEDSLVGKIEGSRLKYVDNQIRQQRALQQLGMIQNNAWRPQRGLPERSVSVLRAWLFEHFLHPYPKDSDKVMLAKQTGLTRSQVSNWFINARVRLWKPMVEEMYVEEMKEHQKNGSDENTTKTEQNQESTSKSPSPQSKSPNIKNQSKNFISNQQNTLNNNTPPPISPNIRNPSVFNLIGSSQMENNAQESPKKPRNADILLPPMNTNSKGNVTDNDFMSMRQRNDDYPLMGAPTNFIGGFDSYPIVELGRFGTEQFQAPFSGNGVSLSLGLPHCDNLSMSAAHQSFLPNQLTRGVEIGEENDFNSMNASNSAFIQNRKRYAAQLLQTL